jgi:hypothetical protein
LSIIPENPRVGGSIPPLATPPADGTVEQHGAWKRTAAALGGVLARGYNATFFGRVRRPCGIPLEGHRLPLGFTEGARRRLATWPTRHEPLAERISTGVQPHLVFRTPNQVRPPPQIAMHRATEQRWPSWEAALQRHIGRTGLSNLVQIRCCDVRLQLKKSVTQPLRGRHHCGPIRYEMLLWVRGPSNPSLDVRTLGARLLAATGRRHDRPRSNRLLETAPILAGVCDAACWSYIVRGT